MAKALVVGASRGIGLELAKQLAERGDSVVATCRGPSAALASLPVEVVAGVDVTSDESVASFDARLGDRRLDMTGHEGTIDASECARLLLARLDEPTLAKSGAFVHASGEALPF